MQRIDNTGHPFGLFEDQGQTRQGRESLYKQEIPVGDQDLILLSEPVKGVKVLFPLDEFLRLALPSAVRIW